MQETDYIIVCPMRNYTVARDTLLGSIAGMIPKDRVIILYSGEPLDSVSFDPYTGYITVTMTRNIYEYGAFLVPQMLPNLIGNAFLLLHDTCVAHPNFGKKVSEMFTEFRRDNLDILWCSPSGQCNICIFNSRCSDVAMDIWRNHNTVDKMLAIAIEHDRSHNMSLKSKTVLNQRYSEKSNYHTGSATVYGKHKRQRLYYSALDMDKYYVYVNNSHEHPQEP